MIGLDRGLLSSDPKTEVVERHQRYADLAGSLDIIVFAPPGFVRQRVHSNNLRVFATQSAKFWHFRKAAALGLSLAKQVSYDLLVTQEFSAPAGVVLKRKLDLPWIVNIHSMFFDWTWLKFSPKNWYLFYRIKISLRDADGFRVNNAAIAEKLKSWGLTRPILVQPTPVDVEKFQTNSPPSGDLPLGDKFQINNQIPNSKITILYVGRLSKEKNVAMLIKSFSRLSSLAYPLLELQIVGEGLEEQKLKRLAAQDPRITFLGRKTHDELIGIYQNADIFVLPSNTESFGKVLVEAAAAGCAIVATATTGAKSILREGETGLLVAVGAEDALRDALVRLTADENLRQKLGANAQAMSRQYDQKTAVQNVVSFWKSFV